MIHLLEVHPGLTIAEVKKLSRRYAMTGGYEIALKEGLGAEELLQLVELYAVEMERFQELNSECRASNAFRILSLVQEHSCADTIIVERVAKLLRLEG